jgi:hypothetical protein
LEDAAVTTGIPAGGVITTGVVPLCSANHTGNEVTPVRNSVTMAKPEANVAVSITRFFSTSFRRSNCERNRPTSAGLAASAT